MNRMISQHDAELQQQAEQSVGELSVISPFNSVQPIIRYATDAEVDEAMKKVFEWHGPLLKKLAE